ncbi:hypothetical protein DICVIV_09477 [Dictyocaulus viviparus]|uniref:Uncharacterized protein n=1 Tax=Dictyocaulus viviparus TaxID=29172 RepID=A0A0D8XIL4_DICVI|nr:hypothetical protein DICVIV_09477 [Dictyocaulus viviparus]
MRLILFLTTMNFFVLADDSSSTDVSSKMVFAQRFVDSLPRLPDMIHNQIQGKPNELKEMISHMLGDGLISQLVVNPLGVAEGMGVPLSSLGINKTDVGHKFDFLSNANISGPLFRNQNIPLLSFTTPTPTTTERIMYLDGVPIKDFDQFVRNRKLEGRFSTRSPITTTTPLISSNDIAAAVLDKLKQSLPFSQPSSEIEQKPVTQDYNVNMLDPLRIQEVDTLLRRAPQRLALPETLGRTVGNIPSSFVRSLDPEIEEVVTSLRTGNVMSVERVRQLQNILQTFEQSLQTKELIAKRKQLQLLQDELAEQRKKIEEQRRMEEELRKKEQDLEEQRKNMEIQLQQQLHMWHNSFGIAKDVNLPLPSVDYSVLNEHSSEKVHKKNSLPLTGSPSYELDEIPITVTKKSYPIVSEQNQEEDDDDESKNTMSHDWPEYMSNSNSEDVRYSERRLAEYESEDREVMTSSCECQKISLLKMKGKWSISLASKSLIEKMQSKVKQILQNFSDNELSCSKLSMSTPKISLAAQDAPISWEFRTTASPKLHRLTGSALSLDHRSVQLQIKDFSNKIHSLPMCVLKYSGDSIYDYMVVANANGPCKEAVLFVRNPDEFFDENNNELVTFLKNKIADEEIDSMDIVPFANDCS